MKIKILKDADYRISSAISQSFRASEETVNVPKATAEALISRGVAEAIQKPASKGE